MLKADVAPRVHLHEEEVDEGPGSLPAFLDTCRTDKLQHVLKRLFQASDVPKADNEEDASNYKKHMQLDAFIQASEEGALGHSGSG